MVPQTSLLSRRFVVVIRAFQSVFAVVLSSFAFLALIGVRSPEAMADEGFRSFLSSLRPDAERAGVSVKTFNQAFSGVKPNYKLPDLAISGKPKVDNRGQAEFTKTAADYISRPYMEKMSRQGRAFYKKYQPYLERIESWSGVDPYIIVAIWGRETAYGFHKLPHDAIEVLATLAYVGRRKEMFREELLAALKMLEIGVPRRDMRSSWAGALGLTQFMPTEYFKHAADGDGDGKIDIWRSVPDALASAARQLQGKGWVRGVPWGVEVTLGQRGADCALEGPPDERPIAEWASLGLRPARGGGFRKGVLQDNAYLMMAGGSYGPAFLVTDNFKAIRAYNTSDLYALFVGHLSDRIRGGGDFHTPWADFAQPRTMTVHDLQARLKALGYAIGKVDGKIGSNTRKQIGLYQRQNGIKVDCWPSDRVLRHASRNARAP